MFKSVFVKYISAFMLIIALSIFMSTSIITTLVNIYDDDNRSRTLSNVAGESAEFMIGDYSESGSLSFDEYLNTSVVSILPVLNAMTTNADDIFILVADVSGNVKLVAGNNDAAEVMSSRDELVYPASVTAQINEAGDISRDDDLDGFLEEKCMTHITPIVSSDGKVTGSVLACAENSGMDELLEAMIRTVIMSTLWLMLAALIAVYFITERFVAPVRSMSKAAREFGQGHFDVRVEVNGDDEIAGLAKAFNNMAGALQHSEETRRLFLANVSHDLRTPMTTITGFIDSILEGVIPEEKIPHYLEVISSEVKRLSRLVSNLLDITKIQAGERKFTPAPFDICETAREIIIASEQRLEEKKLDVQFDCDRDNMTVNADRDAIHQVLYNLCDNAIKFSRPGGKYVVSVHETGGKAEVSVYNEGDGISPDDLPYVFDRFYKSDRSRGLDKTGVGLGLYICRTIIEAQGENIKVESEYGSWCRFSFTLPKADNK